jgi:hypothetical protein
VHPCSRETLLSLVDVILKFNSSFFEPPGLSETLQKVVVDPGLPDGFFFENQKRTIWSFQSFYGFKIFGLVLSGFLTNCN